jgi:uncharacterized SAM-binding protein YcdF (DUF218 family)
MPRRSSQSATRGVPRARSSGWAAPATERAPGGPEQARPANRSRLLVADRDAAERVAIELVRNHLIAHPAQNLAVAGSADLPLLRAFLRRARPVFQFTTRPLPRGAGFAVMSAGSARSAAVNDAVIFPGARTAAVAKRCETQLVIGHPAGTVIVVPGTAADRDGIHALTAEAFGRLRRAEEIARESAVRAVILSGWSGSGADGLSEAEQMMQAWAGPDVPIVLDETARSTAENALCTAAVIGALGDVRDVIVVASWGNALRLRFAFRAALRAQGLRPRMSTVWGVRHGASWRPGLVGLFRLRRHLLAGRAQLDRGR